MWSSIPAFLTAITQNKFHFSPVAFNPSSHLSLIPPTLRHKALFPEAQLRALSSQTLTFQSKHLQFTISVPFLHKTHSTKYICIKRGIVVEREKKEHYTRNQITGLWFGQCTSLAFYPWVNHFLSIFPSVK